MDPLLWIILGVFAVVGVLVRVFAYRAGAELRRRHPPSRRTTQIAYLVFGALCVGGAVIAFVRDDQDQELPNWVIGLLAAGVAVGCAYQAWKLRDGSGVADS